MINTIRHKLPEGHHLTVILIHHDNKAGDVSGSWDWAGDTFVHITNPTHGHTLMHVRKSRWDSTRHGKRIKLSWTDGEGFAVEEAVERDYLAEITQLFHADGEEPKWRTADEIRKEVEASAEEIRGALEGGIALARFESRTGEAAKALGRSSNAKLFHLVRLEEPEI
jgi:hypothetical protein